MPRRWGKGEDAARFRQDSNQTGVAYVVRVALRFGDQILLWRTSAAASVRLLTPSSL